MTQRLIIKQTEADLRIAAIHEEAVLAALKLKYGGESENYTKLNRKEGEPGQFYIGYRGEIAAANWLRRAGVPIYYRVVTDGNSQASEITIDPDGQAISLEVKTAGKPFHKKVMMPDNQKTDFDIILGCRVKNDNDMEICGWLWKPEFMEIHEVEMVKVLSKTCDARNRNQGGPLRPPLTLVELFGQPYDTRSHQHAS